MRIAEKELFMIDLHCHILPMVDDGAETAADALAMAKHCLKNGIDVVVATPHCNLLGGRGNFRGREFEETLGLFRALLRQSHIPLTVLPGSELFTHPADVGRLLDGKKVMTLNRSRYLLAEFNFHAQGESISRDLGQIAKRGYVPVVAHPERYSAVQQDPRLVAQWFSEGYIIQLNKGSLLGRLGKGAHRCSLHLLQNGLAHVIASDAHNMSSRPPGFVSLLPLLRQLCPPDYIELLLEGNPRRIISDKPIPIVKYDRPQGEIL